MTLFIHRNAQGRCPCGAENATCGPPSDVVPVDQLIEEVAAVSGPLRKYKVTRGGVETVMKLSEEDAKRMGVGSGDVVGGGKSAATPAKATAATEATDGAEAAEPQEAAAGDGTTEAEAEAKQAPAKKAAAKKATAANKARTTSANKAADGGN